MVASALLGIVVLAVISSVAASQQTSFEGRKQILAAMAADDLMLELVTLPYEDLRLQDGFSQPAGSMATLSGAAYSDAAWALSREVGVVEQTLSDPGLGVAVKGLRVNVAVSDEHRVLASIETFIPEPAP